MAKSVNFRITERGQGFHLFTEPAVNPLRTYSELEVIVSDAIGYDVKVVATNVNKSEAGVDRVYILQRATDFLRDKEIAAKKRAAKQRRS